MATLRSLDIPAEVQDRLNDFDDAFTELERDVAVLLEVPVNELHGKLTSLEKARMDLISAYVANSLFWMYLKTAGHNPSEHPIKQELDRIRKYMARVKELEDKKLAPKINKDATKKFVRSALWQAAHTEAATKATTAMSAASDEAANTTMPGPTAAAGQGTSGAASAKSYASAAATAQSSGAGVTSHATCKRGGSTGDGGSSGRKVKKVDGGGRRGGSPKRNKNNR